MLVTETIEINGKEFVHNYSDSGAKVKRNDGVVFDDAIDLPDQMFTYTEYVEEELDEDI